MAAFGNLRLVVAAALTILGAAETAFAHPHVQVTGRSEIVFAPDGTVKAVKHAWTFDDMFSAFATQGLDKNNDGIFSREELAELAKINVESLKEFEYFTAGKSGTAAVTFGEPADYWLDYNDKMLTLHFTLPVQAAAKTGLSLDVFDPTYFVAFSLAEEKPVVLAGAPANCSFEVKRPAPITNTQPLSESFFNSLTASSEFGSQFANRIVVTCK